MRLRHVIYRIALTTGSVGLLTAGLAACTSSSPPAAGHNVTERVSGGPSGSYVVSSGIHKI